MNDDFIAQDGAVRARIFEEKAASVKACLDAPDRHEEYKCIYSKKDIHGRAIKAFLVVEHVGKTAHIRIEQNDGSSFGITDIDVAAEHALGLGDAIAGLARRLGWP